MPLVITSAVLPQIKEDQMKSRSKKILNSLTTIIVVMVVILAIMLVGVRLFGLQVYSVLSGSMEPEYPVGSLIYVKKVNYKELKAGDPITYLLDEDTVVTHRIIEVLVDEEDPNTIRYFTQGDANDVPDGASVHYKNIIGKPVFSIPYIGYVSNYIQNPPGMYIAIAAGAILILLVFLPDLFADEDKEKKKAEQK
jgi:signal peptidase